MKLVTFSHGGRTAIGAIVAPDRRAILDLNCADPRLPTDMIAFLAAGPAAQEVARALVAAPDARYLVPEDEVKLLAPVPRPGKFDHMEQGRTEPPEFPTLFCKTVNTVIGPGQPVVMPGVSTQVDYEAELAVVIGTRGRNITEHAALQMVAGYTIFNDVSARDYQKRTSQWMLGKSFDTFGPMGPTLVTADEVGDPQTLELSLTLNGL